MVGTVRIKGPIGPLRISPGSQAANDNETFPSATEKAKGYS